MTTKEMAERADALIAAVAALEKDWKEREAAKLAAIAAINAAIAEQSKGLDPGDIPQLLGCAVSGDKTGILRALGKAAAAAGEAPPRPGGFRKRTE